MRNLNLAAFAGLLALALALVVLSGRSAGRISAVVIPVTPAQPLPRPGLLPSQPAGAAGWRFSVYVRPTSEVERGSWKHEPREW